ncbi:hypothetical protein QYM36_011786 [Artemia franciscana]|uniref:Alpha-carbonic anhydrase domain-containing protein n=1 Tax=Artemia franciscana TaxID=6661 RepID=A0AA88HW35_ARTSF|nr:hypothetical protein QYM36_011786 [Artemia franciscana]
MINSEIQEMAASKMIFVTSIFLLIPRGFVAAAIWQEEWTYDGISGPMFWGRGLINPEWSLCSKGKRQSPIDIDPNTLLFDPNLKPLKLDKILINGVLVNAGHSLLFGIDNSSRPILNISGGPLLYKYEFHQLSLHFGLLNDRGSEHTINGKAFPLEIQVYGYNVDLYNSYDEAMESPQGIVAISVLIGIGESTSEDLAILLDQLKNVEYKNQEVTVKRISIAEMLPETQNYITYEGSMTTPGCQETVTWIVMNKPGYITADQMDALRRVRRNDLGGPPAPLANNYRPIQNTFDRLIRTNIDFPSVKELYYYEGFNHIQSKLTK